MSPIERTIARLKLRFVRINGALCVSAALASFGFAQDFSNHSQTDNQITTQARDDRGAADEAVVDSKTLVVELRETLQNPGSSSLDQIARSFIDKGLPEQAVEREIEKALVKALRDDLQNPGEMTEDQIVAHYRQLGLPRSIIDKVVANFHAAAVSYHSTADNTSPMASDSNGNPSTDDTPPPADDPVAVPRRAGRSHHSYYIPQIQLPTPAWQSHAPGDDSGQTYSPAPNSSSNGSSGWVSPATDTPNDSSARSGGDGTGPANAGVTSRLVPQNNSQGPSVSSYGWKNDDGTVTWTINGRQTKIPEGADPRNYAGGNASGSTAAANGSNSAGGRVNKAYGSDGSSRVIGQYDRNGNNQLNPPAGRVNKAYSSDGSSRVIGQYDRDGNNQLNPPAGRVNKAYSSDGSSRVIGQYDRDGNNQLNPPAGRVNKAYSSDGSSRVIGQYDRDGNNQLNPPAGRVNKAYSSDGSSRVIGQYDRNGNNQLNPPAGRVNKAYSSDGSSRVIGQYDRNGNNQLNPPAGRVNKAYSSDGSSRVIGQYDRDGNNQRYSRPQVAPNQNSTNSSTSPAAGTASNRPARGILDSGSNYTASRPSATPSTPTISPSTSGRSGERAGFNLNY